MPQIDLGKVVGDKGDKGDRGVSVTGVELQEGTHAPGTTDTYKVNLDNGETGGTFEVYNGKDGSTGPVGPAGPTGEAGKDATINGHNTATVKAGRNVTIEQTEGTMTVNAEVTNPNLSHNWYFANPVNRNGKTEYTETGLSIDMWYFSVAGAGTGSLSVEPDGVRLAASQSATYAQIVQFEANANIKAGEKVTGTVLLADGTLYSWTFNYLTLTAGHKFDDRFALFSNANYTFVVRVYPGYDISIRALKLELGDHQTLAHQENGVWVLNEIPDYAEQYAICEQYSPITGEFVGEQHWYRGILDGAGPHNSVYRGANLGSAVTEEQHGHIADGTFKDLFIGDYWVIGGVTYRIAAFDYYYRAGETEDLTTHHAVIVPDTALDAQKMNDDNITVGGYTGSKMYTTYMEKAKSTITAAFSERLLTHRAIFCNAVADGHPSGYLWTNSCIELMNENMVYGTNLWLPRANGAAVYIQYTLDKGQLPLFTFRPDLISNRVAYWLRDVVSASGFAHVDTNGTANSYDASASLGVRPAFTIS